MIENIQANSLDIAMVAAVIAALVSLIGNAFNIDKRYRALYALGFSILIVLLPSAWIDKVLTALIIGLTASGVYTQVKPRDYQTKNIKANKEPSNTLDEFDAEHEIPTIDIATGQIQHNTDTATSQQSSKKPDDEWIDKV
ncbi:hypothetical protein [Bacillus sp. Marseille-P3661]|uniref:hypothetical protein n=1 Tax=Bacillus sp. Marseille-P3661 TaxID=1936234 RepID=UPI000C82CD34|nr:hypothetical protein [Bacillus sp. Marseille-P3661]